MRGPNTRTGSIIRCVISRTRLLPSFADGALGEVKSSAITSLGPTATADQALVSTFAWAVVGLAIK
jgi:hypothetical protein